MGLVVLCWRGVDGAFPFGVVGEDVAPVGRELGDGIRCLDGGEVGVWTGHGMLWKSGWLGGRKENCGDNRVIRRRIAVWIRAWSYSDTMFFLYRGMRNMSFVLY